MLPNTYIACLLAGNSVLYVGHFCRGAQVSADWKPQAPALSFIPNRSSLFSRNLVPTSLSFQLPVEFLMARVEEKNVKSDNLYSCAGEVIKRGA